MADGSDGPPPDWLTSARARMVRYQLEARGIHDAEALRALGCVRREEFLPHDIRDRAYEDGALAIGHGQTISQPFIVARMTEALDLSGWRTRHPGEMPRVLDVGTGSGYQAAVLAEMGAAVTSIEWDPDLSRLAGERLARMGYTVELVVGDGGNGYAARAPYAGILLAAAAPGAPPPLAEQLADGGNLVLPIGPRDHQQLIVVHRDGARVEQTSLEGCVFVPLLGQYGYH